MNYKLLFPTYRTRHRFVRDRLGELAPAAGFPRALNLGSGEGDYDPMIAGGCQQLISCDINHQDIEFARESNAGVSNLSYQVESALDLSFPDAHFDLVVSVDVLEHVGDSEAMVRQIARVLKPGGVAIISFPQTRFPFTYDPINRLAGRRALPIGAYGFGHEVLIDPEGFEAWAQAAGMDVVSKRNLSGGLVGLTELYWPGLLQSVLKANSGNDQEQGKKAKGLRPSTGEPGLVKLTDALIDLDHILCGKGLRSVGLGYVLRRQES